MTLGNKGRTPSALIKVNNKRGDAIIDSGSNITIISKDFLSQKEEEKIIWGEESIKTIAGSTPQKVGRILVNIEITGKIIQHVVVVMEDCPFKCLLGMDILEQLGNIALDLQTGNLVEAASGKIMHKSNEVYLDSMLTIPPRSEFVYYASTYETKRGSLLFEPNQQFIQKYEMPVCYELVLIESQRIPVRLTNLKIKPTKVLWSE